MSSELQKKTDKAVSTADQIMGVSGTGTPAGGAQPGVAGPPTPGFGLPYGGLTPVEEPQAPSNGQMTRPPDSAMYSVPGTPIISGFLTDVTEYNPELQGRAAVLVYEKMRRGDGQVEAVLQALSLPILSAEWNVVPREANSQEPRANEVAEFVKENLFGGLESRTRTGGWASQSWHDVLRNAVLMLAFGVSVHEDVYTVDGDKLRLRMLADLLPITFYRWHVDDDGRTLLYLGQYGYRGARFYQVSVPADKLCVFNFRREGANYWGRSILRPAYPHWYVKNQLYRIAAIGLERNHVGVPVITLPPGHSSQDQTTAYNFVTQLAAHERTGIVLPHGATFEIVGVKGMLTEKTMELMVNHHNEQITVQALATFLNLGRTQTGSRALGQSSQKFFMLAIQNIANLIAETITQTTIRRLVYYNFGEDAPCPRLVAANVQARALEDVIDALQKLGQVGAFVADRPVRNKLRADLGLPEEVTEDVSLPPRVIEEGNSQKPKKPISRDAGQKALADGSCLLANGSQYWRALRPEEERVNLSEIETEYDRAETKLGEILRSAQDDIIRTVARAAAEGLRAGRRPNEIIYPHDATLARKLAGELEKTYQFARRQVAEELKSQKSKVKSSEPSTFDFQLSTPSGKGPVKEKLQVIAEGMVEDVEGRYGDAARRQMTDLKRSLAAGNIPNLDDAEQRIVEGLGQLSEAPIDQAAREGARQAMAEGSTYIRSEILDKNICAPCTDGDGTGSTTTTSTGRRETTAKEETIVAVQFS